MKNLSLADLETFVSEHSFRSVSFDIDGTVYPIRKVQLRWWKRLFTSPGRALRFLEIKWSWEKRRKGESVDLAPGDIQFFEDFLTGMLDETLVPLNIRKWITDLRGNGVEVFFLSDHGASEKLIRLGLTGTAINCLSETGELKPHQKISSLLKERYRIDPAKHLHLGDRWTDEAQARLLCCSFRYFKP